MKKLVVLFIMSLGVYSLNAQRLQVGQKALEVSYNVPFSALNNVFSGKDYTVALGYTLYQNKGSYWLLKAAYHYDTETFEKIIIPKDTYLFQAGYTLCVVGNSSRNVALNAGLGGVIGYKVINGGKYILADGAKIQQENYFVYGVNPSLRLERYLMEHIIFFVQSEVYTLWGGSHITLSPEIGAGLRITL